MAHLLVGCAHLRRSVAHRVSLLNFIANQETIWVNEGVSTTIGIEEAIAFVEQRRSPEVAAVHFDMLAIAADGNRVLTERLDRFVRADGSEVAALKVMGIFEVEGNCIVAWRDYFDVNFANKPSRDQR